jgi:hypothetical protein
MDRDSFQIYKQNNGITEVNMTRGSESLALIGVWQFVASFLCLIGLIAVVVFAYPISPWYEGAHVSTGDIGGMVVGILVLFGGLCLFDLGFPEKLFKFPLGKPSWFCASELPSLNSGKADLNLPCQIFLRPAHFLA